MNIKIYLRYRLNCQMVNGSTKHLMMKIIMTPTISLHDVNVAEFLAVLDTCKGNVYLITREGDHLNLKSKLCQLVGLTQLIEGGKISEAYIICENKEDESKLFRFNLFDDMGDAKVAKADAEKAEDTEE